MMRIQLLEQRVDHLLLVKHWRFLALGSYGVKLVKEQQARPLRPSFLEEPLDRIGCASNVLADGALKRDAEEAQPKFLRHRLRYKRFAAPGWAMQKNAVSDDAVPERIVSAEVNGFHDPTDLCLEILHPTHTRKPFHRWRRARPLGLRCSSRGLLRP
jgi:hypothetical protein